MSNAEKPPEINNERPVLVAGASGFMGSHTVRQLVAAGRKVRILVRPSSNLAAMGNLPVEISYGDVSNQNSLSSAIKGCDSVFYSVLDPRFWLTNPEPLYRCNVDGLINAMEAALATGIKKFVFTSTMGTLGFNADGPVDETIAFNWREKANPYILARLKAETVFLEYCRTKGLPGVALCVANTYGPEDYQPTPHGGMLSAVARGSVTRAMASSQPTVDIRDAAAAALLAEQYGIIGERYIIANEYISNKDFYAIATNYTGKKAIKLIPHKVAFVVAWAAEKWFKLTGKKDYLLSTDAVFLSGAFKAMDSSKARSQLQWQPRPVQETVQDAIDWYQANAQ